MDAELDEGYLEVVRQRHALLGEILAIEVAMDGSDVAKTFEIPQRGGEAVKVVEKYSADDTKSSTQNFQAALQAFRPEDKPFPEFDQLASWPQLVQHMQGCRTATTMAKLQEYEDWWVNFKALLAAFVASYKKSCRNLRDSFHARAKQTEKKKQDAQAQRDRHAKVAKDAAEKMRAERVKKMLTPVGTTQWFPVAPFTTEAQLAKSVTGDADARAMIKNCNWSEPFVVRSSEAFQAMLDEPDGPNSSVKACLGRFKYHMRLAPQFKSCAEGRVWSPLGGSLHLPNLETFAFDYTPPRLNLMALCGAVGQHMQGLWIHGMREDMVFSSHTPQFCGLLILAASGTQDIVTAPFTDLADNTPSAIAGDAGAFTRAMQDRRVSGIALCMLPLAPAGPPGPPPTCPSSPPPPPAHIEQVGGGGPTRKVASGDPRLSSVLESIGSYVCHVLPGAAATRGAPSSEQYGDNSDVGCRASHPAPGPPDFQSSPHYPITGPRCGGLSRVHQAGRPVPLRVDRRRRQHRLHSARVACLEAERRIGQQSG